MKIEIQMSCRGLVRTEHQLSVIEKFSSAVSSDDANIFHVSVFTALWM